jgi:hypothetical protein
VPHLPVKIFNSASLFISVPGSHCQGIYSATPESFVSSKILGLRHCAPLLLAKGPSRQPDPSCLLQKHKADLQRLEARHVVELRAHSDKLLATQEQEARQQRERLLKVSPADSS